MVYAVSYPSKHDAQSPHSEFSQSFFAESESEPEHEKVLNAVKKYSSGDFAAETIRIEERPDLEANGLKKHSPFVKLD